MVFGVVDEVNELWCNNVLRNKGAFMESEDLLQLDAELDLEHP